MKELQHISTYCFACGQNNEHGLKMRFFSDGERVRSDVAIPAHLRGWGDLAHGGIVSTILDEIMAWSALHLLRKFVLTKHLKVTFIRPVRIESDLVAQGWVLQAKDERSVIMSGEIRDDDGTLCARGQGEYALFDRERFEKLGLVPREVIDAFSAVVESDA